MRTLSGFLGGYSGLTRDAYALDLRQFAQWCHKRRIALFAVGRHDIEAFARHLEDLGRAHGDDWRNWLVGQSASLSAPWLLSTGGAFRTEGTAKGRRTG